MKLILYTGTKCHKCPAAREVVREVAKELGWKEGVDFVEKLIDGIELEGEVELEGEKYHIVKSPEDIKESPSAVVGEDISVEALMFQIASTPSIVFNEEPVFIGDVPTKEKLLEIIKG